MLSFGKKMQLTCALAVCSSIALITPARADPASTDQPQATLSAAARAGWRHALLVARKEQIARLRQYRKRGVFPTWNQSLGIEKGRFRTADGPLRHRVLCGNTCRPIFVDDLGVHCAVGFLMRKSGWGKAVDRIAKTNNEVYVDAVKKGDLIDWIELSGLTREEAAEIQPAYEAFRRRNLRRRRREQRRLVLHFIRMERKLIRNTKRSLDVAMKRLMPRIEAGLSISRVGATQPRSSSPRR